MWIANRCARIRCGFANDRNSQSRIVITGGPEPSRPERIVPPNTVEIRCDGFAHGLSIDEIVSGHVLNLDCKSFELRQVGRKRRGRKMLGREKASPDPQDCDRADKGNDLPLQHARSLEAKVIAIDPAVTLCKVSGVQKGSKAIFIFFISCCLCRRTNAGTRSPCVPFCQAQPQ